MPHTKDLLRRYKGQGLVFIGIHSDPGKAEMQKAMKELGMTWPILFDGDQKLMGAYHGDGYPSYYLVDKKGKLRIADIDDTDLERAIQKLLKEK